MQGRSENWSFRSGFQWSESVENLFIRDDGQAHFVSNLPCSWVNAGMEAPEVGRKRVAPRCSERKRAEPGGKIIPNKFKLQRFWKSYLSSLIRSILSYSGAHTCEYLPVEARIFVLSDSLSQVTGDSTDADFIVGVLVEMLFSEWPNVLGNNKATREM